MNINKTKKKLTIYDVTETSNRAELEDWVNTVLSNCVFNDEEENIKKRFKTTKAFVKAVTDKLLDGTVDIDESWEDGEDALNIENIGFDMATGEPIGSQDYALKQILQEPDTMPDINDLANAIGIKLK